MVFFSLKTPSPFPVENNSPIQGMPSHDSLLHLDVKRFPASDRYCRFDLPTVVGQFFTPFRGVLSGNIDEEKFLSLVAIQPG